MKFRKASSEDKVRAKAAERLRTVPTSQAMNWAEQAITSFHQSLDLYRMHKDVEALAEARKAVSMIAGAMDVIEERNQD